MSATYLSRSRAWPWRTCSGREHVFDVPVQEKGLSVTYVLTAGLSSTSGRLWRTCLEQVACPWRTCPGLGEHVTYPSKIWACLWRTCPGLGEHVTYPSKIWACLWRTDQKYEPVCGVPVYDMGLSVTYLSKTYAFLWHTVHFSICLMYVSGIFAGLRRTCSGLGPECGVLV